MKPSAENREIELRPFVSFGRAAAVLFSLVAIGLAVAAIVNAPDIKPRLLELGTLPEGDTSEHFAAYVKDEIAKWKRVIETGKIPKI